jgi:hypothetical protein
MAEDLDNVIRDAATGPAKATVDGTTVEQQPLPDIIEADKHLGSKAAGKNPIKAFTRVKIVSPGTV